jgi:hypothetical protein
LVSLLGEENYSVDVIPGRRIIITERNSANYGSSTQTSQGNRVLHLECGNMMCIKNIEDADIVMLETDIPQVID